MLAVLNRLLHTAERNRAYFHRVILGLASSGVLVGLLVPLLGGPKAGYIVSVVSLLLGGSPAMAAANTSTKKNEAGFVNLSPLQWLVGLLVVLAILWFLGVHVRVD